MTYQTPKEVVEIVVVRTISDRENAILLHDYVRENVKFSFNNYFDASTQDYTLAYGQAHWNARAD